MGSLDQSEHIYTTADLSNNKKRPQSDTFSVWYIFVLIIILAFFFSGGPSSIKRLGTSKTAPVNEVPYYGTGKSAP